jgi:hypothetical protein
LLRNLLPSSPVPPERAWPEQSMYEKLKSELDSGKVVGFSPGQQISEVWIARAEAALGVQFPPSYRWWLESYGAAMLGDQSVFTIFQLDFHDSCGPDIVYQQINNVAQGIGIPDGLVVFEPESSDEIYYFDL